MVAHFDENGHQYLNDGFTQIKETVYTSGHSSWSLVFVGARALLMVVARARKASRTLLSGSGDALLISIPLTVNCFVDRFGVPRT